VCLSWSCICQIYTITFAIIEGMDSVNSSHKKRFNNGRRGWIPAGLWLRFMLNFFRIMLMHVPIVVNSMWRLVMIGLSVDQNQMLNAFKYSEVLKSVWISRSFLIWPDTRCFRVLWAMCPIQSATPNHNY